MVVRKQPSSLCVCCLNILPEFVFRAVSRLCSRLNAAQWLAVLEGRHVDAPELLLEKQIGALRSFLFEQVLPSDVSSVMRAVLMGVERSVNHSRRMWHHSSDVHQYRSEVEHLTSFVDLVFVSNVIEMDFGQVPKGFRGRIANRLDVFAQRSRQLVLGAEHKWMLRRTANTIARHLGSFQTLTVFSCKRECTSSMLRCLSKSSSSTSLLVLDVEGSRQVEDSCLNNVLRFSNLVELNIFNTEFSHESQARILMRLTKLRRLSKADYLCDALGWIDYLEHMEPESTLGIMGDLMPSQKYFFHEIWQMEMVSRRCPMMDTISFSLDEKSVIDYMAVLADFEHLSNLEMHGGNFYRHKIDEFVKLRGSKITKLNLIDIEDVDYKAIAILSNCCVNLKHLTIMHCDHGDFRSNPDVDPNSDQEYERRQRFVAMATDAQNSIVPMVELEELVLESQCKAPFITFLCSRCPRLRRLTLGSHTEVSDSTLTQIVVRDGLRELESFECESSGQLGIESVQLLLNNCTNLRVLRDLQHWSRLHPNQIAALRQRVIDNNIELDTRSHQKARRLVEMSGDERRSYLNTITGPIVERMRRRRLEQH